MTPAQCRAARGLLDMTQQALAERAGVGRTTVRAFEAGSNSHRSQREAIRTALVGRGVEMLDGERPGVRFALEATH